MLVVDQTITAKLWAGADEHFNYQIEAEPANVTVERTDSNEIGIHAVMPGGETEDAGLYFSVLDALQLAALLCAAAGKEWDA